MLKDYSPQKQILLFFSSLWQWVAGRTKLICFRFEKVKGLLVDKLLEKRGAFQRPFIHVSVLALAIVVLISSGALTSFSVVSGSYPGVDKNGDEKPELAVIPTYTTPVTIISDKPRDEIIEYEVKGGDTVSAIAERFGVTSETILWENDLFEGEAILPGEMLRILPVSGVAHEVGEGDTIYSVADKYRASAQAILDFPFNDVGDDFVLTVEQVLIVPGGAPPEVAKPAPVQYLAQVNIPTTSDISQAGFIWPAGGDLAQYFAWYHPGIDISNQGAPGIAAAAGGRVIGAGWLDNWGYGNRVLIDHGNGYTSLYAHLSANYVAPGQYVSAGQIIGRMGSTGRSTGIHLHLEIRRNGVALNPLALLK